eukprot:6201727-Pleurochrysis_carterae.AAC.1
MQIWDIAYVVLVEGKAMSMTTPKTVVQWFQNRNCELGQRSCIISRVHITRLSTDRGRTIEVSSYFYDLSTDGHHFLETDQL